MIYFSLGSNMQGTSLPEDARNNFLNVFKQLPNYRVIWKWESNIDFPGKADNVLFVKWIPQQDLLGNPNVKRNLLLVTCNFSFFFAKIYLHCYQ